MGRLVLGVADDEEVILASDLLPDVIRIKLVRSHTSPRLAIEAPQCVRIGRVKATADAPASPPARAGASCAAETKHAPVIP